MGLTFWTWTVMVTACLFFIAMSLKFRKKAGVSFTHYAIAGGTLPFFLILFTDIATIMGVGNFIGHSAEGYKIGFANIPFVIGEQGAKVLFALVFAGFAARFTYHTLAELMHDLILRDRISRILIAILTSSIMLAWVSGQAMGLGALFATFTGADPLMMIIIFHSCSSSTRRSAESIRLSGQTSFKVSYSLDWPSGFTSRCSVKSTSVWPLCRPGWLMSVRRG